LELKNLIIDIGNTRLKAATFKGPALVKEFSFDSLEELVPAMSTMVFDHVILSSVKWTREELNEFFPFPYTFLTHQTPLPIHNLYGSPETLGMDRIAAVMGALNFAKEGPVLAIDFGTCITYDFLDAKNNYLGGAISPGIGMRFVAMHANTARLPLTHLNGGLVELTGNNTHSCLQSGVQYGVKFELEGIIARYKKQHKHLRVFICGGDAKFFESLTKDYIFVIPNLILHGLNRILTYNVNKN
jgi:type III pantothenate kinase